ncbi:MAG: response regulator [Nitrospiraceae bacterium]|nr:MAG: response regulator [Nitrospiraceae bacterium]
MKDSISILIVDDEPIAIMSAERVLKAEGYSVEGVLSAKEAMQCMEKNNYDLVLTDLNMLEIDGIALVKWIKNNRPSTGIVVITGYLLQETIKEALKLGVNDHMMKPFTPAALKNVIHNTITCMRANSSANASGEDFPQSMFSELDQIIHQFRNESGSTVPVLAVLVRAQDIFGYLPYTVQKHIAQAMNIYPSEIHSIVSLHSCFRTKQDQQLPDSYDYRSGYTCALPRWKAINSFNKYLPANATAQH